MPCYDGFSLLDCSKIGVATTALVSPSTSASMSFNGNQNIKVKLKNHNVLPAPVKVHCNYQNPPNLDWFPYFLPGGYAEKGYSVFGNVPIGWNLDISTNSDAVNVSMAANWDLWKK